MIGLLYWLLSTIFREASLGRNRLRRPKRFYTTPKTHVDTARWVIRYTNKARAITICSRCPVISRCNRPPKGIATGWLCIAFPTLDIMLRRLTNE